MKYEKDMGNRYDTVSDSTTRSTFGVDKEFPSALSGRASKLASALYLVTSLMPEGDPVRTELRNVGVTLVSDIAKSGRVARGSARDLVPAIVSLLELSKNAGLMSAMNADVLSEKFIEFSHGLTADGDGVTGRSALALLSDSFPDSVKDTPTSSSVAVHKGQRANLLARHLQASHRPLARSGDGVRRAKIIDFIKDRKRAGIKEIAHMFPGLSEKTVQRELLQLVRERVIAREGERRWSVYSIA